MNGGFGPLVIVIALAVAAAVGGGVYYAKNNDSKDETKTENKENVGNEARGKGSIRSLLSLGKEAQCTVTSTSSDGTKMSGTTYVAGNQMRGDFTMTASNGTKTESHMIRNANDIYVWTGTQGAKMNISELQSQVKATSTMKGQVDFNQDVDYECEDWDKDESKFTVPTNVTFVDVAAMMKSTQGQMDAALKANVNANLNLGN